MVLSLSHHTFLSHLQNSKCFLIHDRLFPFGYFWTSDMKCQHIFWKMCSISIQFTSANDLQQMMSAFGICCIWEEIQFPYNMESNFSNSLVADQQTIYSEINTNAKLYISTICLCWQDSIKKILRVQQERGSRYLEKQAGEPGFMWVFPPRASGKRRAGPGALPDSV